MKYSVMNLLVANSIIAQIKAKYYFLSPRFYPSPYYTKQPFSITCVCNS